MSGHFLALSLDPIQTRFSDINSSALPVTLRPLRCVSSQSVGLWCLLEAVLDVVHVAVLLRPLCGGLGGEKLQNPPGKGDLTAETVL